MPWIVLVASAVLEAVWATALGRSEGFTRPVPTIVFVVAAILSLAGLSRAMKDLPVSVAYSVWVGLGAGLTAGYAMASGAEPASTVKVLLLLGLIGSVVGLRFVTAVPGPRAVGSRASSGSGRE